MTGLPNDLTARLATLGLEAPTLIQRQRDVATWLCAGKTGGGGAIIKIGGSGRGSRILVREKQWLEGLSFTPPVRLPRVLASGPGWLVMEQLMVPHIPAPQATEVLGRDEIQQRLAALVLQLPEQEYRPRRSFLKWSANTLDLLFSGERGGVGTFYLVVFDYLAPFEQDAFEHSEDLHFSPSSPTTFSHGDLNERNILIDPSQDWIGLIDFQEAGYRMPGYDLISLCHHARQPLGEWRWQRLLLRRCWNDLTRPHGLNPVSHLRGVLFEVAMHHFHIDARLAGLSKKQVRILLSGGSLALDEPRRRYAEAARLRFENIRTILDPDRFPAWANWALEEPLDYG